jgi:hypothetical protein
MTLDFQWNEDDFAESERLKLRSLSRTNKGAGVLGLFVFGFVVGGMLCQKFTHITLPWQLLTAGLFAVALLCIARFMGRWLMRRLFRAQYRKLVPGVQLPRQLATDEHGVVYATAMYKRRASWASIVEWRETRTNFQIYIKFNLFALIPKRDMPASQVSAFRELLSSRVHRPQRTSSMLFRLFPGA